MLDLNSAEIQSEGRTSSFDSSKIFGYEVVEKVDGQDTITKTLDNVVVSGFNQAVSANGSKFWDLQLKDTKGNETNMREYDIDQTREGWEKKQKSQITRLKHIVSKFAPEGTALPSAATFPELWTAIENLMKANQCNTKPLRLKLTYNRGGYLAVPAYVPFMELMTVPAADTKLRLSDFDTLVRPQKDNPANVMASSGGAATTDAPFSFDGKGSGEDLPF